MSVIRIKWRGGGNVFGRTSGISVAASETLHQRQQIAQQQAYVQLALQYRAELSVAAVLPLGPTEAKAAVVMFLTSVSKMAPVVENPIKANPIPGFISKEFPIFPPAGIRTAAAESANRVWLTRGGRKYPDRIMRFGATGRWKAR